MKGSPAADYLRGRMEAGIFPGARYRVARGAEILEEGWLGRRVVRPADLPVESGTIYDLASLTKPLVTGALSVLFAARGLLDLEGPLERTLSEASGTWVGRASLLDLLSHRSGLPAWVPLYLEASSREGYLARILSLPADYRPGTRVVYSCLGYILLALVLERRGGAALDLLAEREIFSPLGLKDTGYCPPLDRRSRIAATEEGNERERALAGEAGRSYGRWERGMIWGECHDLNARELGGVSGNAGLFSTAQDLHHLALEFLGDGTGLFGRDGLDLFRRDLTPALNENRSVGWQLGATPGSSSGPFLSPEAMGHTGFTGTSLWIDPEEGWILIRLTNRVHPRYRPDDMNAVRREFHRSALSGVARSRRR